MAETTQSLAQQGKKKLTFSQAIQTEDYKNMLNSAIADPQKRDRFVTSIVAAVSANPALQKCTPVSIITAALQGEALQLSPSPSMGDFWMVPYGKGYDRETQQYTSYEAQFQLGVNGRIQLAMRSGEYADLDTVEVRQGEYLGRDPKKGKPLFKFEADEEKREKLPIIGYLAFFELLNGFAHSVYFSKEKVIDWADRYSKAFNRKLYEKYISGAQLSWKEQQACSSPWYERFDSMAENTVLKQCLKRGPKSIEMRRADELETKAENAMLADVVVGADEQPEPPTQDDIDSIFDSAEQTPPTEPKKRGRKPKAESEPQAVETEFTDTLFTDTQADTQ